jgi:hypothetical protein
MAWAEIGFTMSFTYSVDLVVPPRNLRQSRPILLLMIARMAIGPGSIMS